MATPEISGFFDPEKFRNALRLRKQTATALPKFGEDQIAGSLEIMSRNERLVVLETEPKLARQILNQVRESLKGVNDVYPSRPSLTAYIILNRVCAPGISLALEQYSRNLNVFAVYFDYSSGVSDVVLDIYRAEQELAGVSDQTISETLNRLGEEEQISTGDTAQIYLSHTSDSKRAAQFLVKDPSGLLLVHNAVEEIREDSAQHPYGKHYRILSYQEPQIVLAGAEFAEKAYQALYPLTDL